MRYVSQSVGEIWRSCLHIIFFKFSWIWMAGATRQAAGSAFAITHFVVSARRWSGAGGARDLALLDLNEPTLSSVKVWLPNSFRLTIGFPLKLIEVSRGLVCGKRQTGYKQEQATNNSVDYVLHDYSSSWNALAGEKSKSFLTQILLLKQFSA